MEEFNVVSVPKGLSVYWQRYIHMWPHSNTDWHTGNKMGEKGWRSERFWSWRFGKISQKRRHLTWSLKQKRIKTLKKWEGISHKEKISMLALSLIFECRRKWKEIKWPDQGDNKRKHQRHTIIFNSGVRTVPAILHCFLLEVRQFLCFHSHLRPPFISPRCCALYRTLLGCPQKNTEAATTS